MSYTQCTLEREKVSQGSFIPTKFAKIGSMLKLHGIDGWQVTTVGAIVQKPPNVRQQIKAHKDNTGDSLPKKDYK